ncbi:MAG: ribosome recycling factor [Clostridia bacterium]|nr:ribosome recycling factor [Clostridia bacterium]
MSDDSQIKEILDDLKKDLNKSISFMQGEFQTIRAGRANPHILDKIMVESYGTLLPLNQMSNISVAEARVLTVNVWDISLIKSVTKAISSVDLGVNVADDGRVIRLSFPILTEERRKEILKGVKSILENTKIAMRSQRRDCLDFLKNLKKEGELTEDKLAYYEKEVQKIFDNNIAETERIYSMKEKEILDI